MSRDGRPDPATEAFLAHRNLLFTVAYEMLGSAADAEDVLQETWLRWAGVGAGSDGRSDRCPLPSMDQCEGLPERFEEPQSGRLL